MKKTTLLILAICVRISAHAQSYTITNWLDEKKSATVLTFDDWDPSAPAVYVPKMINAGVPGTFYVTINNAWRPSDYPDMIASVNAGCEIGNHTVSHPDLALQSNPGLVAEVTGAANTLNANVPNQTISTIAYPFGSYNQNVIDFVKQGHIGGRAVSGTTNGWGYNFPTVNDEYYEIPTVQVGTMGSTSAGIGNFTLALDNAIAAGGLYTIMYHSVGGLGWFDDISSALFDLQLDTIKARDSITWVTTLSNAVKYHKEKHCATLSTLSKTSGLWTLNLTDTLANNIAFNQELTIKLKMEPGDTVVAARQDGSSISFEYTVNQDSIIFNAVPDGGSIELDGIVITGIDLTSKELSFEVFPNPFSKSIVITGLPENTTVTMTDLTGHVILRTVPISTNLMIQPEVRAGVYLLSVSDGNRTFSKRVMKY